jgi:hypothetical protein
MASRTTRVVSLSFALLLLLALAGSAAAAPRPNERAKPTIIYFEDIEEDIAATFSAMCGFPVTVDAEGWFKIISLDTGGKGKRQPLEVIVYHLSHEVFTSAWGTFTSPLDVGPDIVFMEDGVVKVALTGRSTTGSGVIGRVVVNTETGEVEFEAGRRVYDDFVAAVCEALAPPSE